MAQEIDVDRIEKLLNLADLVRDYPNLKPIQELVHRELAKLNEDADGILIDLREKEAEAKEREDAERHSERVRAGDSQDTGAQSPVRRHYQST